MRRRDWAGTVLVACLGVLAGIVRDPAIVGICVAAAIGSASYVVWDVLGEWKRRAGASQGNVASFVGAREAGLFFAVTTVVAVVAAILIASSVSVAPKTDSGPKASATSPKQPSQVTSTSSATSTTSSTTGVQPNSAAPFFLGNVSTCCGTASPQVSGEEINGTTYPHSIWNDYGDCEPSGQSTSNDYNLGRRYGTFTATIGESDTSAQNIILQWDVSLDGKQVYTKQLIQGESVPVSIPVTGNLTLTLTTTQITSLQGGNASCSVVQAAWGDAEVHP